MKIIYVANIRLPTEKAHGVQIMKTCESLVQSGAEVELLVTDRSTPITDDPFVYYGIATRFPITHIRAPNALRFGRLGFWFDTYVFARRCRAALRRRTYDVVYGRDEAVLAQLDSKQGSLVWETHTGADNRAVRTLIRDDVRILAISQGLKDFYIRLGAPAERIVVARDAVDLEPFAHPESQALARARLGLPLDRKIAMYIGRLDGWKGSETLLEASTFLSEDVLVVIIGGEEQQIKRLQSEYPRAHFVGFRPYREIADNQAAADVLIIPNTGRDPVSVHFTSPLKLFTYMASGKPIVASDLPSIREVVNDDSVYFFTPDDPQSLARTISEVLHDEHSHERVAHARQVVSSYTWSARAQKILQILA